MAALLGGCAYFGGSDALASAAVGLVLVVIFFLIGRLPVLAEPVIGAGPAFFLLALNYTFRIIMLLVALVVLEQQNWVDPMVTGLVVIVGALGWNVLEIRRHIAIGHAENAGQDLPMPPAADSEAITAVSTAEVNADA